MAMRRLETDEQRSFIRIDGQSMEPTRVRLAFPPMRTGPERRPYGFAVGGVWIDGERQFSIGVYVSDNWLFTVPERNGLSESLYSHLEKVVSSDVAHGDALPAGSGRLEQLGTVRWPHGAQMLQHVDWAARQVRELPDAYVDSQTPIAASGACLEAFLVNARALTDFLTRRGDARDFSAWDLVHEWTPEAEVSLRLRSGAWMIASQQIVHFSRERLQEPSEPFEHIDTSYSGLSAIRTDILQLFDAFQRARRAQQVANS